MESKKAKIRISRSQSFYIDVFEKTFNIQGFPPLLVGEPLIINGILCRPWEKILPPELDFNELISVSLPKEVWEKFHDFFRINNVLYKIEHRVERRQEPEVVITLEEVEEWEDPAVVLELKRELEELKLENQELKQKKEDAEKKLHEAVEEEIKLLKKISCLQKKLEEEKKCWSATREFLQLWWNELKAEIERVKNFSPLRGSFKQLN